MFEDRIRILGLVCFSSLLVLWGRVAYIELALGPWYRAMLAQREIRVRAIPASRGTIRARDGTVLAQNRCDADLTVHYRYLEQPPDDAWLTRQARSRLTGRNRRNPDRVELAKNELRDEIESMWQALAELTRIEPAELDRRARIVQRRVERVVESVNRRHRDRWARQSGTVQNSGAPTESDSSQAGRPAQGANPTGWRRLCAWLSDNSPPAVVEPQPVSVVEQSRYYALVENISSEVLLEFTAHPERYPGVRLEQRIRRVYPEQSLACAVVGYTEPTPCAEVGESDSPGTLDSGVGRTGLEGFYDIQLRGTPGQVREQIGMRGSAPRVLGGRAPRSGYDMTLTLDLALQRYAEELLERAVAAGNESAPSGPAASGAIVVLDVHTGAVLAAGTAPRFDLNVAAQPSSPEAEALTHRPDAPLFNRVVQMSLPPGSVFKPVVALAALKNGINPRETYFCRGYLHEPDRFRCLIFRHYGVGHESVTMTDAIVRSCNVYFFHVSERIGWEKIIHWARTFGFGRRTGIDLATEEPGYVPDPDKLRRVSEGEMLGVAIGQGSLSVTPIQIAVMTAAIANGGMRVVPHVRSDAFQPPRPIDQIAPDSDRSLALLRQALEQVVADPRGTGHAHVFLSELEIAGKTGTAQSGSPRGDHAWFAGFVPAKNPACAIVVVLEHAGPGGQSAGRVARELVRQMIGLGYFATIDRSTASDVQDPAGARR